MGRKRGRNHSLTITQKALSQAAKVAFWHSPPPPPQKRIPKAVNGESGVKVVSYEEAQRDRSRVARPKRKKNIRAIPAQLPPNIGEPIGPSATFPTKTEVSTQPWRLKGPSEAVIVSRSDNRLCAWCNHYFHKTCIDAHKLNVHGVRPQPATPPASAAGVQRPAHLSPSNGWDKVNSQAKNSWSKPSKQKQKRQAEFYGDGGQPKFEGGIQWVQAGSPGLGKRR